MADLINPYLPPCSRRRDLPPRWRVVRIYRSERGPLEVENDVGELFEVDHLVEGGPHRDTLVDIRITLNTPCHPELTLEDAQKLQGALRRLHRPTATGPLELGVRFVVMPARPRWRLAAPRRLRDDHQRWMAQGGGDAALTVEFPAETTDYVR